MAEIFDTVEENIEIPEQTPQEVAPLQQDPPSKVLWNALHSKEYGELYDKSYEDFQKEFSTPEAVSLLHQTLASPEYEFYTAGADSFEKEYFPELKKKASEAVATPTAKDLSVGASNGTTSTTEQPIPTNDPNKVAYPTVFKETKVVDKAIPVDGQPKTIIDSVLEANADLNKKTKTQQDGHTVELFDYQAKARGEKSLDDLKSQKIDVDNLYNQIKDLPAEIYNVTKQNEDGTIEYPYSKENLSQLFQEEPAKFAFTINHLKNVAAISKAANGALVDGFPVDGSWFGKEYNRLNVASNLDEWKQNKEAQKEMINTYLPDMADRKAALDRLEQNASMYYTPANIDVQLEYEKSPLKNTLDISQFSALEMQRLFNPNKYQQSVNFIKAQPPTTDEAGLKISFTRDGFQVGGVEYTEDQDSINRKLGKETVLKNLSDEGRYNTILNLQYKNDKLLEASKKVSSQEQLDAIKQQYDDNTAKINAIKEDYKKDAERYPYSYDLKYEQQVKDFMQQAGFNAAEYGVYKFGMGFIKTGRTLGNLGMSAFGDSDNQIMYDLASYGESIQDAANEYLPNNLKSIKDVVSIKVDAPLQKELNAIIRGRDLKDLDAADLDAMKMVLSKNQNQVQYVTNTDKEGKSANFWSMATLYSNAGMLGDIASFGVQAGILSAAGVPPMLASAIPLFTTSQDDFRKEAIAKGMSGSQVDGYANVMASIMFMAGMISPKLDILKKAVGVQSEAGKMIAGISDKTWNAVIEKNRPIIDKIRNSVTNVAGSAAEMTAVYGAGVPAAQGVVGKEMYNDNTTYKDIAANALESSKHLLTSSAALLGFTAITNFKTTTLDQKAQLWKVGSNPKIGIEQIDEAVRKGELTLDQANQRKAVINDASNIIQNMPTKNSKGERLTDEQRINYFYNLLLQDSTKKEKKVLPTAQQEKIDYATMVADHSNDLILDPKTAEELQTRKKELEDALTPKKDKEGKEIKLSEKDELNAKAVAEAIDMHLEKLKNAEQPVQTPEELITNTPAKPITAEEAVAEAEKPLEESDITVGDVINKTGTYKGEKGSFYLDGQTVVFAVDNTNREYELGNVEQIKNNSISDFGIEHNESVVSIGDNGQIVVRGKEYKNNYSDPMMAINRDADGNVISVNLETADGKKRTFKGNAAEDIAYQIHLQEINKNNETADFEQFINEDPTAQETINNGAIPIVTPETPIATNEPVQREKIEPIAKVEPETPVSPLKTKTSAEIAAKLRESKQLPIEEPKTNADRISLAERFRNLKSDRNKLHGGLLGISAAVWDGAMSLMAVSIEGGMKLKDAITKAVKYIKENWKGEIDEEKLLKAINDSFVQEESPATSGKIKITNAIKEFIKEKQLPDFSHTEINALNTKLSREIADAYDNMKHEPNNPEVKAAYEAMMNETKPQYEALVNSGIQFELWSGKGEPYPSSKEMLKDLNNNSHLYILPNEEAFGEGIDKERYKDNIGLQSSGYKDINGKSMTNSEMFRGVHDAIAHGVFDNKFDEIGEENAALIHSKFYSKEAQRAVLAQTRGQNSWVNFNKNMYDENGVYRGNRYLENSETNPNFVPRNKRPFAEPKIGLLPEKYNFTDYGTEQGLTNKASQTGRSVTIGGESISEPQSSREANIEANAPSKSSTYRNADGTPQYVVRKGDAGRGEGISVKINGVETKAKNIYEQSEPLKNILKQYRNAYVDPYIVELSDADLFHKLITEAKAENKKGASVYVYTPEEYSNMRLFVTPDGKAGVAIKSDGDLVSGFSNGDITKPKRIAQLLTLAVKEGAKKADSFDVSLPQYYINFGLKPVVQDYWSEELKPEGWNYEDFKEYNNGRPDVVYYVYDGGDRSTIQDRIGEFGKWSDIKKDVPYLPYEQAVEKQTQELNAAQGVSKLPEGTKSKEQLPTTSVEKIKPITEPKNAAERKTIADQLRQLKSGKGKAYDAVLGIPVAIWDGSVELVATAIEGGTAIAEAIKRGINYIERNHRGKWDKKGFNDQVIESLGYRGIRVNGEDLVAKPMTDKKSADVIEGFYSPLEQGILDINTEKLTGKEWAKKLEGTTEGDELKFTGMSDFLSQNADKSLTKQEVLDYMKNNRIEIVEVVKGGPTEEDIDAFLNDEAGEGYTREEAKDYLKYDQEDTTKYSTYQLPGESSNYKEVLITLPENKSKLRENEDKQYKLDLERRSLIETVKVGDGNKASDYQQRIRKSDLKRHEEISNELDKLRKEEKSLRNGNKFKSSHFDEPNILAHVRMNIRFVEKENEKYLNPKTYKPNFDSAFELIDEGNSYKVKKKGASSEYATSYSKKIMSENKMSENDLKEYLMDYNRLGKEHTDFKDNSKKLLVKVLHIEEFQSDWGQQGKKQGFSLPEKEKNKLKQELEENKERRINIIDEIKNAFNKEDYTKWKELNEEDSNLNKRAEELNNLIYKDKVVPQAPFVTETANWTKLAWKVALKEAIKEGADKITWTTGEQQNERYDLSKQVDNIHVEGVENQKGLHFVDIELTSGGKEQLEVENGIIRDGKYEGKRLDDVIGKEYADKVLSVPEGKTKVLRGEDLKVGGAGMKGFYGSPIEGKLGIVGEVAKSLFKQEPKTVNLKGEKPITIENTTVEKGTTSYVLINENGDSLATMSFETGDNFSKKDLHIELVDLAKRFAQKELQETTQHSIDITPEIKEGVKAGMSMFKSPFQKIADQFRGLKSEKGKAYDALLGIPVAIWDGTMELIAKGIETGEDVAKMVKKGVDYIKTTDWYKNLSTIERQDVENNFTNKVYDLVGIEKPKKQPTIDTEHPYLYSGSEAKRISGLKRHLMDAENLTDAQKKAFENNLYYEVANNEEARQVASGIVDEFGEADALAIARWDDMHPSVRSAIYAETIDRAYQREISATTDAEKIAAAEEWKDRVNAYDKLLTAGGQFTAYSAHFYKTSPLGFVMRENEKTAERFNEWFEGKEPTYKELLDKLNETAEGQAYIQEEVERLRKIERTQQRQRRDKNIDDFFDKAKIKGGTYSAIIPPSVWNKAMDAMKVAVKAGDRVVDAVQKAIEIINAELGDNWDKDKFKKEYEDLLTRVADDGKKEKSKLDPIESFQKRAAELKRRIDEGDFSAEEYKDKKTLSDKEKAAKEEYERMKKAYDDAKKTSPEWQDKMAKQFLDKFRERMKGLTDDQKSEVVRRSIKKLAETGALNEPEFKKIVADTIGLKDLTTEQIKEIENLTNIINSLGDIEDRMIADPTPANIEAYKKAKEDSIQAGLDLYNLTYKKSDIVGTFKSIITGALLGIPTLIKNPVQNIMLQGLVRFPTALIKQLAELGTYGITAMGNKLLGTKIYEPTTNILLAQKSYFKGLSEGLKRGWFNFKRGTQEQDYFDKTSYQSTLAPRQALKDIKLWKAGEKFLTKTEIVDRYIRKSIFARQSDFILRAMGLGDRPGRFGAERAKAIQIAMMELKLTDDNQIIAFEQSPLKMAYKVLVESGVSKDEAMRRATDIEERIKLEGSKAVLEEENLLSKASKATDVYLQPKKEDTAFAKARKGASGILKTLTFPFVKIPANSYWLMFKMFNPEVSIAQGLAHSVDAYQLSKKGDNAKAKIALDKAKDSMAMAALGLGLGVAASTLVSQGYVRPNPSEDDKAREKAGEKLFGKQNQIDIGRLMGGKSYWIDLAWLGPLGAELDIKARLANDKIKSKLKGEPEQGAVADWADGLSYSAVAALNTLVFDQGARTIDAIKGGANPAKVWTVNTLNTFGNIFTGATFTAISKAMLPEEPRLKGDTWSEEIMNNVKYRNGVVRLFLGRPPARISMWGEPIKKDNSFSGVAGNMLGFEKDSDNKFGAILYSEYLKTQDPRFFPPVEDNKLKVDGQDVEITQAEKDDLEKCIGKFRKELVSAFVYDCSVPQKVRRMVKNEDGTISERGVYLKYSELTDAEKVESLEDLYKQGKESGFELFLSTHPQYAPAKLTSTKLKQKEYKEAYSEKFKMDLEKVNKTIKEKLKNSQ